jgi:hypothetical protein
MKETTQQRNSRIANDDLTAHSAFNHAIDFFRGLATYEITPSFGTSFGYKQVTPRGQLSGWAKTYEEAVAKVEELKNAENCNGYTRKQLGSLV